MNKRTRALSNVKLIDLSDERAIYGVKLLADLGADVIRPEPKNGDSLRQRGPFDEVTNESLWYAYFASSRRFIRLDESAVETQAILTDLASVADVLVVSDHSVFDLHLKLEEIQQANPQLVVVECSSFGPTGEWKDYLAPDLVAGALGGSVGVTGDADTPPLKPFGELNFTISGAYVAVAVLAGLRAVREFEQGQRIHVPVHECIASCLEHVLMWYMNHSQLPNSRAKALERRGSLHWTNLYHVMYARDGAIMVTPTPNIDAQLAWLIEEDAFDDLLDPEYQEPGARGKYVRRMMDVLRNWVSEREVEPLFFAAQEHHAPYGWVQDVTQVAANPQLQAREWWTRMKFGEREVKASGPPYRLSKTPAHVSKGESISLEEGSILSLCGWEEQS